MNRIVSTTIIGSIFVVILLLYVGLTIEEENKNYKKIVF